MKNQVLVLVKSNIDPEIFTGNRELSNIGIIGNNTSASTNCNKTLQHFGDQSRGWGGKGRIDKVWNRVSHGPELSASMEKQGLYVFPTHRLKWEQKKQNYSSVIHSHTSVQWGSRYNGVVGTMG